MEKRFRAVYVKFPSDNLIKVVRFVPCESWQRDGMGNGR